MFATQRGAQKFKFHLTIHKIENFIPDTSNTQKEYSILWKRGSKRSAFTKFIKFEKDIGLEWHQDFEFSGTLFKQKSQFRKKLLKFEFCQSEEQDLKKSKVIGKAQLDLASYAKDDIITNDVLRLPLTLASKKSCTLIFSLNITPRSLIKDNDHGEISAMSAMTDNVDLNSMTELDVETEADIDIKEEIDYSASETNILSKNATLVENEKIDQLNENNQNITITELKNKISSLKAKKLSLKQKLKSQLNDSEQKHKESELNIKKLKEELNHLKSENEKISAYLNEERDQTKLLRKEKNLLEDSYATLQNSQLELRAEINKLQDQKNNNSNIDLNQINNEKNDIEKELSKIKIENQTLKEEIQLGKKKIKTNKIDIENLKLNIKTLEKEKIEYQSQITNSSNYDFEISNQLTEKNSIILNLQNEKSQLEINLNELSNSYLNEISILKSKLKKLKTQINSKENEHSSKIKKLEEMISSLEQEIELLTNEKNLIANQNNILNETLQKEKSNQNKLKNDLNQLKSKFEELNQQENENLEQLKSDLQNFTILLPIVQISCDELNESSFQFANKIIVEFEKLNIEKKLILFHNILEVLEFISHSKKISLKESSYWMNVSLQIYKWFQSQSNISYIKESINCNKNYSEIISQLEINYNPKLITNFNLKGFSDFKIETIEEQVTKLVNIIYQFFWQLLGILFKNLSILHNNILNMNYSSIEVGNSISKSIVDTLKIEYETLLSSNLSSIIIENLKYLLFQLLDIYLFSQLLIGRVSQAEKAIYIKMVLNIIEEFLENESHLKLYNNFYSLTKEALNVISLEISDLTSETIEVICPNISNDQAIYLSGLASGKKISPLTYSPPNLSLTKYYQNGNAKFSSFIDEL